MEGALPGQVEQKSIIVTGSGSGIGEAIARDLAAQGGRLVIADINLAAAERVANAIRKDGAEAIAVKVDVVDRASVQAMIKAAVKAHGRLDVMFNNAGISKAGQFLEASEADFTRIMNINALGVLIGMQEAAKQMIAQGGGGKIINTASIAGKVGEKIATIYCASKACVISLSQAGAEALGEYNITVNCFSPGFVKTPLWDGLDQDLIKAGYREEPNAVEELARNKAILKRVSTPEDLVGATTFLASDRSNYITGQNLMVEGGVRMV
jgi:meso-butanediol dehydrogenase / (S,S)-butanediol dehydrogenase / diacetyl reductase